MVKMDIEKRFRINGQKNTIVTCKTLFLHPPYIDVVCSLKRSKIHMLIKKRQSGLPLRLIDSKTRSEYRRHKTATILTGYDCPVPTSCTTTVHILTSLVHLFSDMIFYKEYFNRWKYSPINGSIIPHLKEFSQY